ncbi:MAG TPA: LTA synthase family protein [Myxococcota bacterium]|nr:LTA synthase family protein [Myxococcota bacterium]
MKTAIAPAAALPRRGILGTHFSPPSEVRFLLAFVAAQIALFTAFRVGFVLAHLERLRSVPGFLEILPLGLRFDAMTAACVAFPAALALLLLPRGAVDRLRPWVRAYAVAALLGALFLELVAQGFLDEYDSRPNRLFLEYLTRSREVAATILAQYPGLLAVSLAALMAVGWLAWRASGRLLPAPEPGAKDRRLVWAGATLALLLLGMHGSLGERGATRSLAAFSRSHLANELVPNSLFTLACAFLDLHMERSPEQLYGSLPREQVVARVARWSRLPASDAGAAIPLLHDQQPLRAAARPPNLVIVLEESFGAQFVAGLGGRPLAPNLEALGREGLWFTNLYATGTRTVRGLESTICGFLPTPSASVVKLGLSQRNFFTIAALLKRHGYATDYLYGGQGEFDNMRNFLVANGFDRAFDQSDFPNPDFVATWGVSDEDLFAKANEVFRSHGDKPFFALVLSTSNHSPFEFPDGRIELYDAEKATRNNAVKYADHAIGELFRQARQEPYFRNTVWVVVADHDTRAPSDDLLPLQHFHIPGVIVGPGIEPRVFSQVASQVDLLPTALSLLGIQTEHPMPGRDLLRLPPDDPGRAVLQYYDVHGFLAGSDLVVHQPFGEPLQFRAQQGGSLVAAPLDPELEKDALAHVLLPWMLYREQRYRLPGA